MSFRFVYIALGIAIAVLFAGWRFSGTEVDYNQDVKPILNKHCIGCHGGVKKAGDVSFLFEHEVYAPGKSGNAPVVKGNWKESEMMHRILSDDPDERMPKDAPPLSKDEIQVLKKWIDQGAEWGLHWAYKKIEKPELPSLRKLGNLFGLLGGHTGWVQNEIDYFVAAELDEKGLSHAPEADRATLIRRVSLDLTGLPPTEAEVEAFLRDTSPDAYEKVVDRLLKSYSFGEKWASMWMDLARYADTKGYERDAIRNIWKYRDYVIQSFNADKPFDVFTTEQLAGDLLQGAHGFPTEEQLIATGFHRNTMTNDEGGTEDEEFRVAALIDRVNSTWEVWQGTSFGCVQCHSHAYDPIDHEEYYKYLAFFNNTRDEDVTSETPTLRFYSPEDSLKAEHVRSWIASRDTAQAREIYQFLRVMEPKINSHDFRMGKRSSLLDSKYFGIQDKGSAFFPELDFTGKNRLVMAIGSGSPKAVLNIFTDSTRTRRLIRLDVPETGGTWRDSVLVLHLPSLTGKHSLFLELESPKMPDKWVMIKWIALQKGMPGENDPAYPQYAQDYISLLNKKVKDTPVIWEGRDELARKTHVFERGNWLVKGKPVAPAVPDLFFQLPENYPANRLGLARWMTHPDNPLTSRVIVNRFWEQLFGNGLVETLEDFGSQGAVPTHQELLDWLAVTFMDTHQWRVKSLLKTIVMSATYRQSSETTPQKNEKDPRNQWLSRGPRVRLSAEQVRDQALAVSGLLSSKMYGPSVMPPQPDGIWLSPYNGEKWVESKGEDRYRRGLYTFWKRTAPYPSMVAFDAPSREFCQSRRIRTNTPLQALVTLNDPVYLEAAERLAGFMSSGANSLDAQLARGYYLLTFRKLSEAKQAVLKKVYEESLRDFKKNPKLVEEIGIQNEHKKPELAALTLTANVLLNLDEAVTKE